MYVPSIAICVDGVPKVRVIPFNLAHAARVEEQHGMQPPNNFFPVFPPREKSSHLRPPTSGLTEGTTTRPCFHGKLLFTIDRIL